MSFSVKAKEFVPSPTANPWNAAVGTEENSSNSTYSGGAAMPTQPPQKERVCMAFYECAECPFADSCAHAHHFTELSPDAQATLLMTVSVESIPDHFLSPTPSPSSASHRRGHSGRPLDSRACVSSFTPYGRFDAAGASGSRARAAANGPSPRPDARRTRAAENHSGRPSLGLSAFDAASTSSAASSSNNACSKPSSPLLALDGFKMRLPARCRYPHKGMPGTYYSFLGVSPSATQEDIIAKYRLWQREAFRRMRAVDPVGAETADRIIVEARNVLGNPSLRAEYDCSLAGVAGFGRTPMTAHYTTSSVAGAAAGNTWSNAASQLQTASPICTANPNNVSSSAGTSFSVHGRQRHGHSLSSSASSAASASGSLGRQHGRHIPSSNASLDERLSPVPALAASVLTDSIW